MTMKHLAQAVLVSAVALAFVPASMAAEKVNTQTCVACHSNIGQFHNEGSHKKVACTTCHSGLAKHLSAPGKQTRPATSLDPKTCGSCHPAQMKSMFKVNDKRPSRLSKKSMESVAPNPFFDRALGYHGFTKEHDEPRSHVFAFLDQMICDRSFGGRFVPKDGWLNLGMDPKGPINVWDVIKDNYPEDNMHKPRRLGTAAAVNPVCWSCKSGDLVLDWAYMGDKVEGATFSRQSNPVDLFRQVNHALTCNMCHDPHNAKPRVIRDALIQATTRTDYPTIYSQDPTKTKLDVKDLGVRGFTRKIAFMEKADAKLMCGQCHVEYNCNPGIDTKTGGKVTMADRRTNLFPFVGTPNELDAYYKHAAFKDFVHPITGAKLTKLQHPDVETYWGSKHQKAGVDCKDCHMPKVKGKNGKVITNHWNTSPRNYLKETCQKCHADKTPKQLNTIITGLHMYQVGKLREVEGRMNEMFDAFIDAKNFGVSEDIMNQARELHAKAHINWEWWTATNGGYFHNPEKSQQSLAEAADAAVKATKMLREAVIAKNSK